jgi:hypothetical protein
VSFVAHEVFLVFAGITKVLIFVVSRIFECPKGCEKH